MRRMASRTRTIRTNRARPVLESLEGRQLLSGVSARQASGPAVASTVGEFSQKDRVFTYTTPTGGHATIKVVGIGNLAGTNVSSSGALDLVYGDTNAYSKIVGQVRGGGGHAPLASILNNHLLQNGLANSLSGVGGNPVASVKMQNFDLIAGGKINLTPGVSSLILDSIGPEDPGESPHAPTGSFLPDLAGKPRKYGGRPERVIRRGGEFLDEHQHDLGRDRDGHRRQHDHRDRHHGHGHDDRDQRISGGTGTGTTTTGTGSGTSGTGTGGTGSGTSGTGTETGTGGTTGGSTVIPVVTGNSTLTGTFNLGTSSTLEAGQSASITSAQGITTSYNSNPNQSQTLVAVSGGFTPQSNLLEPLATGQQATEPPAPPGIILKTNSINGAPTTTVDLLTDSKIFGYDPKTGQLVRFDLNLANKTGAVDPTFAPIGVPGDPAVAGVAIAYNGSQLDHAGRVRVRPSMPTTPQTGPRWAHSRRRSRSPRSARPHRPPCWGARRPISSS